jgi:hypothetical protein
MAVIQKDYITPEAHTIKIAGQIRLMEKKDVTQVLKLLNNTQKNC